MVVRCRALTGCVVCGRQVSQRADDGPVKLGGGASWESVRWWGADAWEQSRCEGELLLLVSIIDAV